jgi:hypothetical protein
VLSIRLVLQYVTYNLLLGFRYQLLEWEESAMEVMPSKKLLREHRWYKCTLCCLSGITVPLLLSA